MADIPTKHCESPRWLETYRNDAVDDAIDDGAESVADPPPGLYEPLKTWQIRILRLEPRKGNDAVVTTLEPAAFLNLKIARF